MAPVRGLRLDEGLVIFDFKPSLGIVASRLATFGAKIDSFREPLEESIRTVMIPSFAANFASGGRPPWDSQAEATTKIHGEHPILILSGTLEGAATSESIWQISDKSAAVTGMPGDAWYGVIHQGGFDSMSSQAAPIPARPFILFQAEDYDGVEQVFSDWLDKQIGAAW
jgi:phage gpG-like protein